MDTYAGKARIGAIAIFCAVAVAIIAVATPSISHAQPTGLEAGSPWPMFLYDSEHTGLSTVSICSASGSEGWQYATSNSGMFTSVAIGADGTIYLANFDLYAFNPDGTLKWEFTAYGGDTESSPAIGADGTIYIGSLDGNLYAITDNSTVATVKWAFPTGDWVESSPAIGADGTIYVGSDDGNLYALTDGGSGGVTEKWEFTTGGEVNSSPAISADGATAYVASNDGNLYATNTVDGSKKWAFSAGADFYSSPTIGADGTIYFSSWAKGLVYALTDNGTSVTKNRQFALETSNSSPAIGADGTIYVGSDDGSLRAINPNGTQKWKFATSGAVDSSAAIGADGTIYTIDGSGTLFALIDGGQRAVTEKWAFPTGTGGWGRSSPAIGVDGTIYFGSGDTLYAQPWQASAPGSLAFGSSPAGDTVTRNFTLKNTSTINPLFISSVTSSDPAEFAETGTTCPAGGLAPGLTCTITIGFTPGALGTRSATLTLIDSTTICPQSVQLSGTGTIAMAVTPTSGAFGDVKVGSKATKMITVHNYQTNPVSLSESVTTTTGNSGDFSIIKGGTCTSTLAAKTICTLVVSYAPTATGTEGATLTVTDSPDPLGPYTVEFSASATIPESLSATKLPFGSVPRTGSKTMSVTVTNHAATGSIGLNGPSTSGAGDFSISGSSTCGSSLGAGANCTYAVTFAPSVETAESGALSINVVEDPNDNPSNVTIYSIALSGTGTVPESRSPAALNFGSVVQTASKTMTVTLTNKAFASGGSLTLTGAGTGTTDFQVTGGTCPLPTGTLSAASCTYAVTFTPSTEALETATLSIGVAGDSLPSVSLSGTGLTPLKVIPASLAFYTVKVGKTSAAKTVTVTNNGGTTGVSLSEGITVITGNSGDFAVSGGTCGLTLAGGGASCTYTVTFTPSTSGAESATLAISAVGDTASHSVGLTGTGS